MTRPSTNSFKLGILDYAQWTEMEEAVTQPLYLVDG